MTEGQIWSSEDTAVLGFKVFWRLLCRFILLNAVAQGTDSGGVLRGRDTLSSLRKVCSLLMISRSNAESGIKRRIAGA